MSVTDQQLALQVNILSPTATLYDGKAVSVSALNRVGPFDVLVGHTNFFSMLLPCEIVVNTGKGTREFKITHGLMKVHDNTVTVFINIGLTDIAS